MSRWTRRDFLKSSVAATAGAGVLPLASATAPNAIAQTVNPSASPNANASLRQRLLLDFGWCFHLGHADDPGRDFGYGREREFLETGGFFRPSSPDFKDSDWRPIDLPHDWAVELPFQNDKAVSDHGAKPLGRDYPATSIGWYRRVFEIPQSDSGKRLSIEFDGVFRDSIATLNGIFLGRNMSGYAPFAYDITDLANYGSKNILVVRVDATEAEGWFYEGAGIYRHVWLVKTNPLHVPQWGTFVTSEVKDNGAVVTVTTELANRGDIDAACRVVSTVVDQAGSEVVSDRSDSVSIPGWREREVTQRLPVTSPRLWSVDQPNLYRLVTTIQTEGGAVDRSETPFGIRTIHFDPDNGFHLNGKPVKIKGTCNHQDHAGVGSALPDRLQNYRIEKLKEMGSNGYRASHNPPTPELLDACDQLGMLVLDETRRFASDPEGLSQLRRMIRRDRNHPCVVFWSTGNEEPEQGSERGARICATMKRLVRQLDPTRPITQAMNDAWGHGISAVLDVQGFNYKRGREMDDFHHKFPAQPTTGTEVGATLCTRGIYANDKEKGYLSAYDLNYPDWKDYPDWVWTAEGWWQAYDQRPFLSGGFVWTGFDYRGEPTPYNWPGISSQTGIMDTCGFPKDNYYYYQAWWSGNPVLHLFPHWNWPGKEGREIEVWCHTNLERVELFLNGQSLGTQQVKHDSHVAWKVKYAPGTLQARGYQGGREALTASRETTGAPAQIELRADRQKIAADGEDVSILEVRVVDHQGRVVPVADNEIAFEVSGAGRLIGVGNGDPSSHEPDKAGQRRVFNGLCVAIVQSSKATGEVKVQATSPGLTSATAVIRCEQTTPRPAVP